MFSIIIVVIAIALVAALSVATIYYGGSLLTEEGTNAEASRVLNEATQIIAALELRSGLEVGEIQDLEADLQPEYISDIPRGWEIDSEEFMIHMPDGEISEKACERVNELQGATHEDFDEIDEGDQLIPSCASEAVRAFPALCCQGEAGVLE